jgi:restriction endonuclease S subunit
VVENWKPKIDIVPEWPMVELGEVLEKINEMINPDEFSGEVWFIGLENIESDTGRLVGNINSKYENIKSTKLKFEKGDILYGRLRPNLNKVLLVDFYGICSTDILVLRPKNKNISKFYEILLRAENFNKLILQGIGGSQLPRVSFDYLVNLLLPIPPIHIQQEIVDRIKEEQRLVENNRNLIGIFEEKIKRVIEKVWGE